MRDHLHLIVEGLTVSADLQRFVKLAKQASGFAHRQRTGARLWQRRYFERVTREEEDTRGYVRYVLENPVRAGLARSPGEYPFIGSGVWDTAELLAHV